MFIIYHYTQKELGYVVCCDSLCLLICNNTFNGNVKLYMKNPVQCQSLNKKKSFIKSDMCLKQLEEYIFS
jgi:hypothetical protein